MTEEYKVEVLKNDKYNIRYILQNDIMWYSLADISTAIKFKSSHGLKFKNPTEENIKYFLCNTPGGKQKHLFCDKKSLLNILRKIKVKYYYFAEPLCEFLGLELYIKSEAAEKTYKILIPILKSFEFKESYSFDKYILDWYSEKYNIILECEQMTFYHKSARYTFDRMEAMKKNFKNPIYITFDPDCKLFNFLNLVEELCTTINEQID